MDVRGASVPYAGKASLADETLRIEMRLLSETRSVLEYLCQHLLTVRSLDIEVGLQFSQETDTGENDDQIF